MKYSPSTAPSSKILDDVRMGEARRELRLFDEHLDEGRVVREVRRMRLTTKVRSKPWGPDTRPL